MIKLSKQAFVALLICTVLITTSSVIAGEGDGGYAGAFLQVPIGARASSMGGAYISISDDGSGPLYNPAGISGLKKRTFGSSYRTMTLDRTLGYLTILFPVQGNAVIGGSWLYAGSGTVASRDSDGDLTGEEIDHNTHQLTITFAKRFESYLSLGVNMSYLQTAMPQVSTASVGFDLGAILHVDNLRGREARTRAKVTDIQIGFTVKNLTKKFRWNFESYNVRYTVSGTGVEQDDTFPLEFDLGGSAKFFEKKLLLASDLRIRQKLGLAIHTGAEYVINSELLLRGGYSDGRLTAGTGYYFKFGNHSLKIDYAFSTDRADEGSEHIFSIDMQF